VSDDSVQRLRAEIADRDRRILGAVNERIQLVAELKRHKDTRGVDFVDPEQEERLLLALEQANAGPLSNDGVRQLFSEILALTKREVD